MKKCAYDILIISTTRTTGEFEIKALKPAFANPRSAMRDARESHEGSHVQWYVLAPRTRTYFYMCVLLFTLYSLVPY